LFYRDYYRLSNEFISTYVIGTGTLGARATKNVKKP
jgi:hypothetical protein